MWSDEVNRRLCAQVEGEPQTNNNAPRIATLLYFVQMKKIGILSIIVSLFGCTASVTLHDYFHFGGEVRPVGNFHYVVNGVTGSASAIYTQHGGGQIKTGLLAEAKRNLWMKQPLTENQAYVNMSIDQSTTNLGHIYDGKIIPRRVEVRVVVSADIVEYEQSGTQSSPRPDSRSALSIQNVPTTPNVKFAGFREATEEELTKGLTVHVETDLATLVTAEIVSTRKRGERVYVTVSIDGETSLVPLAKIYLSN